MNALPHPPPLPKTSMAGRVIAALLLMVGFYALAFGIAGVLGGIAYMDLTASSRVHVKLLIACVVGAGMILWSILPRWERFEAPGVSLTPADQPKLFQLIHEVARATGQPMPAEVYVVNELNAFVTSRGGIMGFGSRRILGIGLPLVQALNVSELRGVLAHEFGHYYGGDVKLGPWIYKTRAAIGRTVTTLKKAESMLQKPFEWYGKLFLRITLAISRRQELAADALAACVVGKEAFISGNRAVNRAAAGFDAYWRSEVVPVLNAGYRPPLAAGFARFTSSRTVAPKLAELLEATLAEEQTDAYDTHPAARDRIAAVQAMANLKPVFAHDPAPAVSLLRNLDALEHALIAFLADDRAVTDALKPLAWEHVGEKVLVPEWREAAESPIVSGLRLASVPVDPAWFSGVGRAALGAQAQGDSDEEVAVYSARMVAAALSVALKNDGWAVESLPGDPVVLRKDDVRVEPFAVLRAVAEGEAGAPEKWQALTAAVGNPELVLSRPAAQA